MPTLAPETLLIGLAWTVLALALQLLLLIGLGGWVQVRRRKANLLRIECHKRWEGAAAEFLFGEDQDPARFGPLGEPEKRLFRPFLVRILSALSGKEAALIRDLYSQLHLHEGLKGRLEARSPKVRALAALEVGNFRVEACYDRLQGLLEGPVPFVAHAAARSMAGTGNLAYAGAVLGWVVSQEVFQRERLLWILEGFGVGIVGWMEARLDAAGAHQDPQIQIFYALLVATFKPDESLPRLLTLLKVDHVEVQAAAIRALAALGNPEVMEELLAFSGHDEWVLRGQAAKSIGMLGGPQGVPRLLDLLRDPVFEVRRNAAHALIHLGSSGRAALKWVAEDPLADPFARDLALERLQWLPEGAKG